jgi:hypothetical protein
MGLLTNSALYDQLWKKTIEYRTVWKLGANGKRQSSNKGFVRQQFEPVWREFGIGHSEAQSSKIIGALDVAVQTAFLGEVEQSATS